MKKVLTFIVSMLFLAGVATNAHAFLLDPGYTVDVTNQPVPAGTLLASQDVPFSNPSYFSGMSHQAVYSNDTGVLFVYSFDNYASSANSITRMTAVDFQGWTTWVDASLVADTAYSADRDTTGSTIGFGFKNGNPNESGFDPGVQPGQTSSVMWIQTNAPQYTVGALSFIDGDVAHIQGYAPAVPEPLSLSLLGSGLFGLIGLRRKQS